MILSLGFFLSVTENRTSSRHFCEESRNNNSGKMEGRKVLRQILFTVELFSSFEKICLEKSEPEKKIYFCEEKH